MNRKSKVINLLFLHLSILVFAFSVVLIKYAATTEFFSFRFFLFYAFALMALFFYAIFWQQILRKFTLSFAYTNRAVGIFWVVLFGVLFFNETLSITHIIGIILIILGVILTVAENE